MSRGNPAHASAASFNSTGMDFTLKTGRRPFHELVAREQLGLRFTSYQLLVLANSAAGNDVEPI